LVAIFVFAVIPPDIYWRDAQAFDPQGFMAVPMIAEALYKPDI